MTCRMVKMTDCTVDVSGEMPGRDRLDSVITCRVRLFVPDRDACERPSGLLPALPILLLCWTVRGADRVPSGWLESYVGLLHLGIASFPSPVTLIERFADGEFARRDSARRVFFDGSGEKILATFQEIPDREVEMAIGERLDGRKADASEKPEFCRIGSNAPFSPFGKRGPCYLGNRSSQNHIGSLGELIHQAAVSRGNREASASLLDERLEYRGYHGCRSICRMRVFDSNHGNGWPDKRPLIVIFTELPDNPGTSVTNRIEHLATLVWLRLGAPEPAPVFIEHYPNRGVYYRAKNRWQIPESFSFVGMPQAADGTFHHPDWQHTSRMTVEVMIGLMLEE